MMIVYKKSAREYLRVSYEKDKHHLNFTKAKYNNKNVLLNSEEHEIKIGNPEIAEEF